jgi:NAD(P)-dependent dehydrogenase (short-subunit alcohol dehydrogenase family)
MNKLAHQVSIITGAGAGMGKAMALLFAAEGSQVLATDVQQNRLDELLAEAQAQGLSLKTVVADMSREDHIHQMFDVALQAFGTVDILVNNAGVMDNFQPVGDLDNATFERVMKINVEGPMKAMRKAIQIFIPKGKGVIVNIASIGGIAGARAGAAYTASKHALIGLTRNTGYIYAKSGIRCNAIAPGAVNTRIAETIDFNSISPLINDRIMPGMALNPRSAEPAEIAQVALFLASDDSSFVNASVLTADGGWSAY